MATEPTKGTEIAALEAKRNELEVLAAGSLAGERRAAWARLAMIVMFALVTNLDRRQAGDVVQTIVGLTYTVFAILTIVILRRVKGGNPERARWRPAAVTAVDFTLVTTMAMLDVRRGDGFSPAQYATAASIVLTFAVARIGTYHVVYAAVLALAGYIIAASYGGELMSHVTIFVLGGLVVLAFMIALTNHALRAMFAGLRQRDNLTRFLPRQVADRVLRAGPSSLAPVEREVTVLFSDIRGFTSMSEGMDPRDVLVMLDDYFGRMSQIVKGHDGVVGKFLGDGLLAYWGVPDRLDDHAARAVRAARDMRRAVRELNQYRANHGLPEIRIGIGIHTGNVAAGMLGGQLQAEYTVIGDAVNVASRIEGLTKQLGSDVLVSETTWSQLSGKRGDRVGAVEIRGRKEPVTLYTIDASAATLEVTATPMKP
ncbi:MAG TPA: adenylate/guanylate cyclase domain-containing protein [Kofleriaceae bacterium]|nr:adenylate/guanylate cyclase domain-containing protein [Kofleriaceae bacterium]